MAKLRPVRLGFSGTVWAPGTYPGKDMALPMRQREEGGIPFSFPLLLPPAPMWEGSAPQEPVGKSIPDGQMGRLRPRDSPESSPGSFAWPAVSLETGT